MEKYFKKKLIISQLEQKINQGFTISDEEREEYRVLHKEIRNFEKGGRDLLSESVNKLKMTEIERQECVEAISRTFKYVQDKDRVTPSVINELLRTATIAFEGGINYDIVENLIIGKIDHRAKLRLNDSLLELTIMEKGFKTLSRNILDKMYKLRKEITEQGLYNPAEKINFNQNRYEYSTIEHLTRRVEDGKSPLYKQKLSRYSIKDESHKLYLRTFERKSDRFGHRFVLHEDFERFYLNFCALKGVINNIDFDKLKENKKHCYLYEQELKGSINFEDNLTSKVSNNQTKD